MKGERKESLSKKRKGSKDLKKSKKQSSKDNKVSAEEPTKNKKSKKNKNSVLQEFVKAEKKLNPMNHDDEEEVV